MLRRWTDALERPVCRRSLWALAAVSVLLGFLLLCAGSGMNPLHLEPLASTWNDEEGYYRTTQQLLNGTEGQSVSGYNEQNGPGEGISPWNRSAFAGFVVFGRLFGMDDPGRIVAANVLFTVLGMAAFVLLARPTGRQALLVAAFGAGNLLWCRYAWSGMCEAQYVALALVYGGAMLCGMRQSENRRANWALLAAGAAAGAATCSRAYYAALILLPLWALARRKKWNFAAAQAVILAASVGEYFREAAQQLSYLQTDGSGDKLDRLAGFVLSGQPGKAVGMILERNLTAFGDLARGFWTGSESTCAALILLLLCGVFLVQGVLRLRRRQSALLQLGFVAAAMLVFEAMVVLYNAGQMGRHLLALDVLGTVWLICSSSLRTAVAAVILTPVLLVGCLRGEGLYSMRLPAQTPVTVQMRAGLAEQLSQVMEFVPGDPWANTVAYDLNNPQWQARLLMPAGFSSNTCDYTYIAPAIRQRRLKSRYVYTARGLAADEACRQNGYPLLLETDQFTLYENTDYQKA